MMESLYDRMTEDSLSDLCKAGCLVNLTVTGYGDDAKFRITIKKGSGTYGTGFELSAEGDGAEGAAALRGAVATAETFLHAVPHRRPAPRLAPVEPPTPTLSPSIRALAAVDPVDVRREANRDIAEQHDEKARELVAADDEVTF